MCKILQQRGSSWDAVIAELTLYDQQRELFEAAGSLEKSCKSLKMLWSGDVGGREEHDEIVVLCVFCRKCPASSFRSAGACQLTELFA